MIYNALNSITKKINDYLNMKYSGNGNSYIQLCNLYDHSGGLEVNDSNKIIVSLVNIEKENVFGASHTFLSNQNGKHGKINPAININLYVLFSSVFSGENYSEGLKFISSVIEFFQSNLVMDHSNTAMLNSGIQRLTFEMVNLGFQELGQLWGVIGGKYMPSVLYKVRMLSFDQEHIQSEISSIDNLRTNITQ